MKKKSVLALLFAIGMSASVATTSITAEAAGLTQASDASQVDYGTVTDEEKELLRSIFDVEYYKAQNSELLDLVGDDEEALFEHFITCGVFEGRTCNSYFDPSAYASAYSELSDAFGNDILKYYVHYAAIGKDEDRKYTTVEACAVDGITVKSLNDENVLITPEIYYLAKSLGTNDFHTVAKAFAYAKQVGGRVVVVDGNELGLPVNPAEVENKENNKSNNVPLSNGQTQTSENGEANENGQTPEAGNESGEVDTPAEARVYEPAEITYFGTVSIGDEYNGNNNPTTAGKQLFVIKGATGGYALTSPYSDYTIANYLDSITVYETYTDADGNEFDNDIANATVLVSILADIYTESYLDTHPLGFDYVITSTGEKPDADSYNCADIIFTNMLTYEEQFYGQAYYEVTTYTGGSSSRHSVDGFDVGAEQFAEYDLGVGVRANDDGTVTITAGLKNDETGFTCEESYTFVDDVEIVSSGSETTESAEDDSTEENTTVTNTSETNSTEGTTDENNSTEGITDENNSTEGDSTSNDENQDNTSAE